MKKILIFDTAVASKNMGDQIIMDAVNTQLRRIFPKDFFLNVPTHDYIDKHGYQLAREASYIFVGGTNLLTAKMNIYNQWRIDLRDFFKLRNAVLMGVGWWQYQTEANLYTRILMRKVLSNRFIHSLRDEYTVQRFTKRILPKALNTGCPTMWDLTEDHCRSIPTEKAENVVFTITDYKPNPEKDMELYNALKANYGKVYLWIQGSQDYVYAKRFLPLDEIEIIEPSLKGYDELLASDISLDYVGTRLHAGIRAMQHRRRSIIIGVDNRATEKKKDFNLPVIDRADVAAHLGPEIRKKFETKIVLPLEAIEKWKSQFTA